MAFNPNLAEQGLLAETLEQEATRMTSRDRAGELVVGIGFLAIASLLVWVSPPGSFAVVPSLICLAMAVLATMVRFETPFGFTVATQLAFVPLLFAVPLTVVPFAVVGALVLARLPAVLRGETVPSRLLLVVGNSWFAIGPVAVLTLAGTGANAAGPALLLAALLAQFAVDFAISSLRMWAAREADLLMQARETAWVWVIDAGLSGIGLVIAEQVRSAPVAALAMPPLLGLLAMFAHERRDRLRSLLELNNAYRGTALVLGDVVEADDGYTGEHCRGVVGLSLAVGEQLGLDAEKRRNLEFAALLHDVGKIAIPKEIINKPGKLDPDEWTIIKTHTIEGQRMLDQVGGFMREVGMIVRSHHERWDGGGYPDGLAGEMIPLEARIITCCDSWNAMRTDRSYRKALRFEVALDELRANAGTQFDPRIVETLIQLVEREQAVRVPAHRGAPARPLQVASVAPAPAQ